MFSHIFFNGIKILLGIFSTKTLTSNFNCCPCSRQLIASTFFKCDTITALFQVWPISEKQLSYSLHLLLEASCFTWFIAWTSLLSDSSSSISSDPLSLRSSILTPVEGCLMQTPEIRHGWMRLCVQELPTDCWFEEPPLPAAAAAAEAALPLPPTQPPPVHNAKYFKIHHTWVIDMFFNIHKMTTGSQIEAQYRLKNFLGKIKHTKKIKLDPCEILPAYLKRPFVIHGNANSEIALLLEIGIDDTTK